MHGGGLQAPSGGVGGGAGLRRGHVPHPTYEEVCTGTTGHREAVQVRFDPGVLPYADLLRYFFAVHDPTSEDRQGPDVGPQYSPAIFYHSEEQKRVAEAVMRELAPSTRSPSPPNFSPSPPSTPPRRTTGTTSPATPRPPTAASSSPLSWRRPGRRSSPFSAREVFFLQDGQEGLGVVVARLLGAEEERHRALFPQGLKPRQGGVSLELFPVAADELRLLSGVVGEPAL